MTVSELIDALYHHAMGKEVRGPDFVIRGAIDQGDFVLLLEKAAECPKSAAGKHMYFWKLPRRNGDARICLFCEQPEVMQ